MTWQARRSGAGDALEQSASQKLESFKRSAHAALVEQVAKAIPYLEGMAKWLGENRAIVEPLAVTLGVLAGVIMLIVAATKVWTAIQLALNVVMAMNPLGLLVLWNNLSFRIPGVSVPGLGQMWGGATLSTPDLPYLAGGGTARQAGMAYIGEHGKEAVYLPQGASVKPLGPGDTAGSGGGIHGELRVVGELRARGSDLVMVLRDKAQITPGGVVALIDGR
ncbi:hypothetical protein F8280_18835 [Micromonospora noduli]|uniref:hypothetical protein n=1 Tax=Micromonospora noduli TaxID=709876 RepID=UPI00124B65DC|nr:hypothetical protein [Micromonospora noduli]KAB1922513.1 hypothetical protein F8280_18835 [Micromonospora noduli]